MDPSDQNLASAKSITVNQTPGVVKITAEGDRPTPQHRVTFEQSPIDIFPPQFSLVLHPPPGNVIQLITPFTVVAEFRAAEPVETVIVFDSKGRNEVTVDHALD